MATISPLDEDISRLTSPVGRSRELEVLAGRLSAAIDGEGGLVLIGGEAGVGKTTLVESISSTAIANKCIVLAGYCYDLTATPPYGPWREIGPILGSPAPSIDLPGALTGPDRALEVGSQSALFSHVRSYFLELAETSPVLLVLEDIHWADSASFDLLRALTRRPNAAPVLVLATYRVDELTRRHPLYQLIPNLVRESGATRLELRSLDRDAIEDLVRRRHPLPKTDADRLVAYLMHHAEGNPLYVRELLRTLEEESVLRAIADGWSLGDLGRIRVPSLIQQVIDGRVERLGEEARQSLAVAAVIGQDVSIGLWESVCGMPEESLASTIERSMEANLLAATSQPARVRFTHALVRESLYEGMLPPRRRILHRKVAEVLTSTPGADPDAIAYHFEQAGDPRAWEWLVRAGNRAQRSYAWRTAADRFEAAAAVLEGRDEHNLDRGWLLYRIGRLLRSADAERSIAYLEDAERIGRALGDSVLPAFALFDAGTVHCIGGKIARGIELMERGDSALAALTGTEITSEIVDWVADSLPNSRRLHNGAADETLVMLDVHPRRGTLIFWFSLAGRYDDAQRIGKSYLDEVTALEVVDDVILSSVADARFGLGVCHAANCEPDSAESSFELAITSYRAIDHHMLEAVAFDALLAGVVLPFRTTRVVERKRLLQDVQAAYERARGALVAGLTNRLFWSYEVLLVDGEWSTVSDLASLARHSSDDTHRFYASAALAQLASAKSDVELAWSLITEVLPRGPESDPGDVRFSEALGLIRLAVDLAIEAGDLKLARSWTDTHDRWVAWSRSKRWRAEGELLRARIRCCAGDLENASETASNSLSLASMPEQVLVKMTAHRLLGEIATELKQWNVATSYLNESLELVNSVGAPYLRSLTLTALARLMLLRGDVAGAQSLIDDARETCTRLGAASLLAKLDGLAGQISSSPPTSVLSGLSDREIEVVRLVARGLTNAQIASELSISPRTVQQHLSNLYGKLNVSSRSAATRIAVEQGLN